MWNHFHNELADGIHGYKNPTDITSQKAIKLILQYWPKTKLIVGLRHPILWFQTYYNFRVRAGIKMPPADSEHLMRHCSHKFYGVCAEESLFHQHLSFLGKTNMTEDEVSLLGPFIRPRPVGRLPNKVFLYELNQLHDYNHTRAFRYRRDLSDFLGLNKTLKEIDLSNVTLSKDNVLDICLERYKRLRSILLKNAQSSSLWIRYYFLSHPDVFVSSPDHFQELLQQWMVDPCEDDQNRTT